MKPVFSWLRLNDFLWKSICDLPWGRQAFFLSLEKLLSSMWITEDGCLAAEMNFQVFDLRDCSFQGRNLLKCSECCSCRGLCASSAGMQLIWSLRLLIKTWFVCICLLCNSFWCSLVRIQNSWNLDAYPKIWAVHLSCAEIFQKNGFNIFKSQQLAL